MVCVDLICCASKLSCGFDFVSYTWVFPLAGVFIVDYLFGLLCCAYFDLFFCLLTALFCVDCYLV